jgi:hypothetical protein
MSIIYEGLYPTKAKRRVYGEHGGNMPNMGKTSNSKIKSGRWAMLASLDFG